MTTDQLFIALTRDLQWEILEKFVGTHAVRNGKLRRKLVLNINNDQKKYLVRDRPCYDWLYNTHSEENKILFAQWYFNSFNDDDHMRIFSKFAGSNHILFCRDENTDDTIYMYRKPMKKEYFNSNWEPQFTPINPNDLIVLPPFEKHVYPSYPYTNKKLGR